MDVVLAWLPWLVAAGLLLGTSPGRKLLSWIPGVMLVVALMVWLLDEAAKPWTGD